MSIAESRMPIGPDALRRERPEQKEPLPKSTEVEMPTAHAVKQTSKPSPKRRIRVRGEELLVKVRQIIHEGNARRIIVIGDDGTTLLEIPLTAGIVGTVIAPALVAIGAIAALATNYTLLIEARHPGA
jgi:hypothetical protein